MISAQTNVDKLSDALDSLTANSFNNWRISPDLSKPVEGDPALAGDRVGRAVERERLAEHRHIPR